MSPPYLPIYGIYLPFQVNLYVPNSKPSNEILFCMLEQLMYQLGAVCIFHVRRVILKRSGLRSSLTRTWLVTRMPSPMLYANQIKIIANKTPPGLLLVGGTRCFEQAMDWCLLVEGEYKLYHSVWEPPIMYLVWKIPRSLGCYVDNESIPLKILFISFQNRALAPLQIPASLCEGPIYLLLCWVIILLLKSIS